MSLVRSSGVAGVFSRIAVRAVSVHVVSVRVVSVAAVLALTVPAARAREARVEPVGGGYFLCGMFQAVKYISLFTGNVEGVLVGAIGGGVACGLGW